MTPWIRTSLRTVFYSGTQLPAWRRLKHKGDRDERKGVLCFSGLTANGAFHLKPISQGLHEFFGKRWDIWHRNLYGHTGIYRDFRKSRMWHWVGDAVGALARMLERHDEKQVFLIGISTGALVLVIAVYLFEFLQRHALQENTRLIRLLSHCGILGRNILRLNRAARKARKVAHIALLVPAFRLQRGRDEFLLALCFGMYYLLNPLVTLAMLVMFPRTWLLILLTAYLNAEVFSRIWIPSGDAIAAREAGANNIASRSLLLVVASCFYCGLAPMLCLLLGIYLGNLVFLSFETSMLLSLLPPLIWQPVSRVNGYSKDRERVDSEGYLWLPVIATSTLIPLQLLARYAVQKIRVPAIIVLAAKDQVVDNETTRYLLKRNEFVEMPELSHGDWTVKHQTAVLSTLSGWLERVHAAA